MLLQHLLIQIPVTANFENCWLLRLCSREQVISIGAWGKISSRWTILAIFLENKKAILTPFGRHFGRF